MSTIQPMAGSTHGRSAPAGYALWEFTGQAWKLKKDRSAPGAVPSEPPRIPGTFDGQLRATPSVVTSA